MRGQIRTGRSGGSARAIQTIVGASAGFSPQQHLHLFNYTAVWSPETYPSYCVEGSLSHWLL